jgi:tetratricopeptide (TPR) repeat protein
MLLAMGHTRAKAWCFAAVVALAIAGPAAAQSASDDPVLASYQLFYSGHKLAAMQHFDDLVARKPADLPSQFGRLFVREQRLEIDPGLGPGFEKDLDALIDAADQRRERTSQDTEALFYEANAYLLRAMYRFDHGKGALSAVRDGARAKGLIETYLKMHPEHGDAYLVQGFYNYYVAIAPTFFHFFRFFLFLPGGDRAAGLAQIQRAATQGSLFAPLAQTVLIEIYASLEGRPADASAEAERFMRKYPDNSDVAFTLAGFYAGPSMDDRPRAGQVYEKVIARPPDGSPDAASARANAILGLATTQFEDWRCDEAIATLTKYIDEHAVTPDWIWPSLLIRRANYRAVMNDLGYEADLRRVLNDAGLSKWHQQATDVQTALATRQAAGELAAQAALIPAHRLMAEHKWDEARRAYEALLQKNPKSPALLYRLALVDFGGGHEDRALPVLLALAADKTVPENIRASAWLHAGRIYDVMGRREDAKRAYKKVIDDYEKQGRPVNYAKTGLVTPFRRPESWAATAH